MALKQPKFTKELEWLKPFYNEAKGLIPESKNIVRIASYKVPLHKDIMTEASCLKYENNRTYNINLLSCNHLHMSIDKELKIAYHQRARTVSDILVCFAHELAHVIEWEHTPRHWELEHKIALKFTKVLKKQNYKDTSTRKPK